MISSVIQSERNRIEKIIEQSVSNQLSEALVNLVDGNAPLKLTHLRKSAKSFLAATNLRQYVQRALNRGGAYHQLHRAIAYVSGNRFTSTQPF